MHLFMLDSIIQHSIIHGYHDCNENDKTCCEFHKTSPFKYIVLSIQGDINFKAKLLPSEEMRRCLPTSFTEDVLNRRAYLLIVAMNAAKPATWPTHPFLELTHRPFNMFFSGLFFFNIGNPADPFIACERC